MSAKFSISRETVLNLAPVNFNEVCKCGSGRTFGICCGKELMDQLYEQEIQAKFPKPGLLSPELGGYKLRFIRNQIIPRPLNEHIQEFIVHGVRWTLGEKWYQEQELLSDAECHCVMRWIRTRHDFFKQLEIYNLTTTDRVSPPSEVMELISLAADLHYLQLENKLPSNVIDRLRNLTQFRGAQYETAVAASLVRAGFRIDWIKERAAAKTCEFNATHKVTGETISVEAKRRHRELSSEGISSFDEIKADIFGLYNKALSKDPGDKPFGIFIDINVPLQADRAFFLKDWVNDLVQRIEQRGKAIFGPKPPAFIAITNCSWHYDGKSPAKWPENLGLFPPDTVHGFKNPLTIEALGYSLNMFGEIPDEE